MKVIRIKILKIESIQGKAHKCKIKKTFEIQENFTKKINLIS